MTAAELASDWVLVVDEMIHLGFPSLERRHRWMEEGLATYLEPILRARGGLVPADELWNNFARMMPNGTPQKGDRGLDGTPTWGRIYWGGALFCFVADLEIRKATTNKKSLDDALRGILAAGGHNGVRWTPSETRSASAMRQPARRSSRSSTEAGRTRRRRSIWSGSSASSA